MITKCRICGKEFEVLYPELWRYVRAKRYLCSWKCLRLYDQKGSEDMYTKVKKDGTPAKKPGPAPKIQEPPEQEQPTPVETELPEKMIPVPPPIEYKVTGISTSVGDFQYFRKQGFIDWTDLSGETISMSLAEWTELMKLWPFVLKVLEVEQ